MNGDNNYGPSGNRGSSQRFGDKSGNYSPSTSFNFNRSGGSGFQQNQQSPNAPGRKRFEKFDKFKKAAPNHSDRIVKQNDIMIRLLKEIRDRLPPLPSQGGFQDDNQSDEHTGDRTLSGSVSPDAGERREESDIAAGDDAQADDQSDEQSGEPSDDEGQPDDEQ